MSLASPSSRSLSRSDCRVTTKVGALFTKQSAIQFAIIAKKGRLVNCAKNPITNAVTRVVNGDSRSQANLVKLLFGKSVLASSVESRQDECTHTAAFGKASQ